MQFKHVALATSDAELKAHVPIGIQEFKPGCHDGAPKPAPAITQTYHNLIKKTQSNYAREVTYSQCVTWQLDNGIGRHIPAARVQYCWQQH